jgi:hypothetical protein
MRESVKHSFIGLIVAIISQFSVYIFFLPLLTIFLPGFLEFVFAIFIKNPITIAYAVMVTLILMLAFSTYFIGYKIVKKTSIQGIIGLYVLQLFLVTPLFLYIRISSNWEAMKDGQFVFGVIDVFPLSGIVPLSTGIVLDVLRALKSR